MTSRTQIYVLLAALLVTLCFFARESRADYTYCGHGYISDGGTKDVYKSYYNAPSGHHHIYYSYVKFNGVWYYSHKHDRVC